LLVCSALLPYIHYQVIFSAAAYIYAGHALNRESQLPVLAESIGSTSGIWAPALRFNNGTFYLLTTMVHDKRADNDSSRWDNVRFEPDPT
jgi:beta-xylosidase